MFWTFCRSFLDLCASQFHFFLPVCVQRLPIFASGQPLIAFEGGDVSSLPWRPAGREAGGRCSIRLHISRIFPEGAESHSWGLLRNHLHQRTLSLKPFFGGGGQAWMNVLFVASLLDLNLKTTCFAIPVSVFFVPLSVLCSSLNSKLFLIKPFLQQTSWVNFW